VRRKNFSRAFCRVISHSLCLPLSPLEAHASAPQSAAPTLARVFLKKVPASCPDDLFRSDDDPKARASQAQPAFADITQLPHHQTAKRNTATETAALIIPAVGNNKLRHETLQNFILVNDSSTIAAEIPILGSPRTSSANSKRATALSSRRWDA